jgi:alkanesulfonate monooxygenase SsuD/methylene tetrahydromethanopterin reductase-like flavin-dependent oxidoreductase (luciferase family)
MLGCTVLGDPSEVKAGLQALQVRTQADEFIIVSDIFDTTARKHSLSLTSQVWGLTKA